MPEFKEKEDERLARKAAELAPAVEAAFARKRARVPLADSEIPSYQAYGTSIVQVDPATLPEANRRRMEVFQKMREIM